VRGWDGRDLRLTGEEGFVLWRLRHFWHAFSKIMEDKFRYEIWDNRGNLRTSCEVCFLFGHKIKRGGNTFWLILGRGEGGRGSRASSKNDWQL